MAIPNKPGKTHIAGGQSPLRSDGASPSAVGDAQGRATAAVDQFACAWGGRIALCGMLAVAGALAGSAAWQKSVTVDEFQSLPHGLAILKTGDFHLATGVQPMSSVLAALPLLTTSARLDTRDFDALVSTWQCGGRFMEQNAANYQGYFLLGRGVSVAALLMTCGLAFGYARSLFGPTGGLVAAGVTGLTPDLLAHGALVTPDIYLAAGVVASLWAFDAFLRRPDLARAALLGCALGLAALAKFSALLLFVILSLLAAVFWLADCRRGGVQPTEASRWGKVGKGGLVALAIGLAVINLGYLGRGSFTLLGQFQFATAPFQGLQRWLPGWLPVPLPYHYFAGMDEQLAERGYQAYLLGEFNETGFYHYYLVALLVKTPAVTLLLCALAWVCGRPIGRREVILLVTAGLLFGFFSLARHKNIGVRYVLFLEPMLAVWIARLTASPWWVAPRPGRWLLGGLAAAGTCLAAGAAMTWPDYLAYFNLPSGGPSRGHEYLLDSNLDWGQDLIALKRYMGERGIASVDLAYFGRVKPEVYGIDYHHIYAGPPQRFAAISANLLWGRMYFVNGTGFWPADPNLFARFRGRKPQAVLGHSIYVYDLGPSLDRRDADHGT